MRTAAGTSTQPGFFERPISVILVILATAAVWGLADGYVNRILLAVTAFLLLLGLHRPV
jgi:hypothetical protein